MAKARGKSNLRGLSASPACEERRRREVHSRRLFVGLGPLDHVHMPAVDALKQQDRGSLWSSQGNCLASFMRAAQRRQISLVFGWSSMSDHRRSRVPARNREYRTPRVGRSHFGGGGSGSRSAVPTYPQPPHKWTTSPDSGRTGGSLRASRIASPHWGHRGADSGSFRTSIELSEHDGHCISRAGHFRPAARQPNTAAPGTEKLVFGLVPVSVPRTQGGRYGALVFQHACKMGLEGIVSKRWDRVIDRQVAGLAKVQESGCAGGEA